MRPLVRIEGEVPFVVPKRRVSDEHIWRVSAVAAAVMFRGGAIAASFYFATVAVTPGEYAHVVYLTVFTPLVTLLSSFGYDHALFRQWAARPRLSPRRADALYCFAWAAAAMPPSAGAGYLLAAWSSGPSIAFAVAGVSGAAMGGTLLVVVAHQRAVGATRAHLRTMFSLGALPLVVRIFMTQLDIGLAWAWVAGDAASAVFSLIVWTRWMHKIANLPGRSTRCEMRRFGGHITVHALWQWGLGSSDRFVLGASVSPAQIATYGASYQVGGVFNALASELARSGLHRYARTTTAVDPAKLDAALLLACWLLFAPVAVTACYVLERSGYNGATLLGAAIYASLLPLILYLPLASRRSIGEGMAHELHYSSLAACAINVGVNLSLVESFGVYAGPIANALGFSGMYLVLKLLAGRAARSQ